MPLPSSSSSFWSEVLFFFFPIVGKWCTKLLVFWTRNVKILSPQGTPRTFTPHSFVCLCSLTRTVHIHILSSLYPSETSYNATSSVTPPLISPGRQEQFFSWTSTRLCLSTTWSLFWYFILRWIFLGVFCRMLVSWKHPHKKVFSGNESL